MATKLQTNQTAPDGSLYVTLTDGSGTLSGVGSGAFPSGATPLSASSGNVAAATAAATLAAASGKTTYITGFTVSGSGSVAALPVSVTVTGTIGGTQTYTYSASAGVLVGNTPLTVTFNPALPASATNTAIVVSCPTLGAGNTNNTTNAYGYQL